MLTADGYLHLRNMLLKTNAFKSANYRISSEIYSKVAFSV